MAGEPGEADMRIILTDEERAILERVVTSALKELRLEVRHTRDSVTRTELKHRENVLRRIADKVVISTPVMITV